MKCGPLVGSMLSGWCLLAAVDSSAQDASAADAFPAASVYAKALRFYTAGVYDSTIETIRYFLKEHGKDPEAEYLVPLIMEALSRRGDYASVKRLSDLYGKKFPSSSFMPRVWYLNGYALAKERSCGAALESFSKAIQGGVGADLDSLITSSAEMICACALDLPALRDLGGNSSMHTRIREIAQVWEIKKLYAAGSVDRAKASISEFRQAFPASRYAPQINDLAQAVASHRGVTVGVLAPLSGDDADVGRQVSQGFALAIDRYNSQHPFRISVITCDTKGLLIETVRKTLQLEGERVPLIVGPMLSPMATAAAGMLLGRETVMLTPTATDDGIAELGPNIFQMNITTGVLARKLARYALANLNIREFATVAPRTAYGAAAAAMFRDEVLKNGGTVFDEEYFEEGGNDFTAQFVYLRNKLLRRKLDLLAKEKGGDAYRTAGKITAADSVKWADSSLSIGAIFIPAEAEDVVMLAPQVAFNRIRAQLLGLNGWRSAKVVSEARQYVQNGIIAAPFEPDSSWKKWQEFRKEYCARFHEEPDRVAALGYDAGTITAAVFEGSNGPEAATARIAESIAALQKFEGASGIISFDRNTRINTETVIQKITPAGFVRVQ